MSDFQFFVSDQLSDLGPLLHFKKWFGACGLCYGTVFFGVISKGRLYFRIDKNTKADYIAHDMGPFTYQMPHRDKPSTMKKYYEVPVQVLEDRDKICAWAEKAIEIAEREE